MKECEAVIDDDDRATKMIAKVEHRTESVVQEMSGVKLKPLQLKKFHVNKQLSLAAKFYFLSDSLLIILSQFVDPENKPLVK